MENSNNSENSIVPSLEHSNTPLINRDIFDRLPSPLNELCELISEPHEKDMFLVSTLPVIAAQLPNLYGLHADGEYSPDLFAVIIAAPATGKGILSKSKSLANALQNHLSNGFYSEPGVYTLPEQDEVKTARNKSLFLPANTSSSAFYDILLKNSGRGLIFETEIDTMTSANSQEWGNFSDITRKAFHHESLSKNRNEGSLFIHRPEISMALSGTFDQMKKLFPSPENGNYSRFITYTHAFKPNWKSHRPTDETNKLSSLIQKSSNNLLKMYNLLNNRTTPLKIELTEDQWDTIDDTFSRQMAYIENSGLNRYLHSNNNRMAVIALRIAMIFTALRNFDNNPDILSNSDSLTPTDEDLAVALSLCDTFNKHARVLFQYAFKKKLDDKGERFRNFVAVLPDEFTTGRAVEIGESMGIPESTVRKWVPECFEKIAHGQYRNNLK
ncbi:DUF3987 domain-containing protein [Gracilimonas sp. BCB1]|uniref:DUF3987 domain-containing protein n=1 Tax=Gracilimonas sp. BCB1 TaxID=3152362 RepID=UPI0032D96103